MTTWRPTGAPLHILATDVHNGQTRSPGEGRRRAGFRKQTSSGAHLSPSRHQGYLNPASVVAMTATAGSRPGADKSPFRARIQLARAVGSIDRVNVVDGGDFGGKATPATCRSPTPWRQSGRPEDR
jgi:hypothetical protein